MPLLAWLALALTSWAWGEALLRSIERAGFSKDDSPNRWAQASALGFGALAQGVFALGLMGRLDGPSLAFFVVLGHLVTARCGVWSAFVEVSRRAWPFVVCGLPTLVLALYPPTGFDSTVYHLPYVTRFLELGRLAFLPELRFPIFPQLAEVAFVPMVMVAGDVGAHLAQTVCLMIGGGVVYRWGLRVANPTVGLWCAALWFGLPLAVWMGAHAYVDVQLALFVAAAAAAWDEQAPGRSGVFLGFAAATKYLGLFFFAAVAALALVSLIKALVGDGENANAESADAERAKRRRGLQQVVAGLTLIVAFTAVASPWYVRLMWTTGNPLFPFYTEIFGDNEWHTLHDASLGADDASDLAPAAIERIFEGADDLLTLPYDTLFRRHRFNFEAPLHPGYLLLVPIALLGLAERRIRPWALVVAAYGLFWLTTVRELRFWLPALPLLHLLIACGSWRILQKSRSWQSWLSLKAPRTKLSLDVVVIALAFVAPGWLYGAYKVAEFGPLPINLDAKQAFLARHIPGFAAIRALEATGDNYSVYALHGERLRHYASGRFVGDWFGPERFDNVLSIVHEPPSLHHYLQVRNICFFMLPAEHGATPALEASDYFARFYLDESFEVLAVADVVCESEVAARANAAGVESQALD